MFKSPILMQQALDKIIFTDGNYNKKYYDELYKTTPSLGRYIYDAVSSHFTLFACGPILKDIISYYKVRHNTEYANYFEMVWKEEWWHYKLLMRDIKNLGFDLDKLAKNLDSTYVARKIFFNRVMSYTESGKPLNFLAPAYIYERSSTAIKVDFIDRIEKAYGNGNSNINSSRTVTALLDIHSDNAHEKGHVEESLKFMCTLSDSDKVELFKEVAYLSDLMWSGKIQDKYPGDEEMVVILESCKIIKG